MQLLANGLIALIALEHLWFMVLESFLWRTPFGRKTFRLSPEQAEATAILAANQGAYNAFLAAGLLWSLLPQAPAPYELKLFFLGCIVIAGVVGGGTANRAILWVQGVPALIALTLTWLSRAG